MVTPAYGERIRETLVNEVAVGLVVVVILAQLFIQSLAGGCIIWVDEKVRIKRDCDADEFGMGVGEGCP